MLAASRILRSSPAPSRPSSATPRGPFAWRCAAARAWGRRCGPRSSASPVGRSFHRIHELGWRDVAANRVPRLGFAQRRFLGFADAPDLARAAGLEDAARRRLERARYLAVKPNA